MSDEWVREYLIHRLMALGLFKDLTLDTRRGIFPILDLLLTGSELAYLLLQVVLQDLSLDLVVLDELSEAVDHLVEELQLLIQLLHLHL